MEVIANAKLAKQRKTVLEGQAYNEILEATITDILGSESQVDSPFFEAKKSESSYHLVIGSDLGLCGAYNINIIKCLKEKYREGDRVIAIGKKLLPLLSKEGMAIESSSYTDQITFDGLRRLIQRMIESFLKDEVGHVYITHTEFKNAMSFTPVVKQILPYEAKKGKASELIYDPDKSRVLDELIKMSTESLSYAMLLEAKVAEQASRRLAMQNANDNAEELENDLILAYNQARQAAITQEITEIIAGADAI